MTALGGVLLLEKYPKSQIDVYVLLLEADGSSAAAAICVASLALANAGIEMRDLVSACSVALDSQGRVVLDGAADEEGAAQGVLAVAYAETLNAVTQCTMTGVS